MRVYILRHAIAEDSNPGGDEKRALTEEGRKKMRDAAAGFARLEQEIDIVYSSPLVRAVQTAEIVAKAIGHPGKVEIMKELSPGFAPREVAERLQAEKKMRSVILSGHEPNCSQLTSFLLGDAQFQFKKGAICLIETDSCEAESGILIWHLSPQSLRLMKK
jgi:phosphohistidine phosphatase